MQPETFDLDSWCRVATSLTDSSSPPLILLLHVEEGIRQRRLWDKVSFSRSTAERTKLLSSLARLQFESLFRLGQGLKKSAADERDRIIHEVSQFVDSSLRRDEHYLADLANCADASTGEGLSRSDAFNSDLQWYALIASYLDQEPEPDRAYAIKTMVDRLLHSLDEAVPTEEEASLPPQLEAEIETSRANCQSLVRDYLTHRIADELAYPLDDAGPLSLWNRRFQLSRLEAERIGIDRTSSHPRSQPRTDSDAEVMAQLESRQTALADLAEKRLDALSSREQYKESEHLVYAAQEESNDVLTLIEDATLPVAVQILHSNTADLRRLTGSLRAISHQKASSEDEQKKRNWLFTQVRKLARRSRNELQEKMLALRLERAFGRSFVSWMENVILILILVMTGLIIAEWVVSEGGETPAAFAPFFAWADLGICTIFLAEFALKFTFAPDRLRYLRRHFLVDLLPSIPFAFISFQASAFDLVAADKAPILRLFRFLRLPQMARYIRVAQPVIRLSRLLFFLLRTADQIVRRNASIFNRNVVLFEPDALGYEVPSYRHRLVRLREQFSLYSSSADQKATLADRTERIQRTVADLRIRLDSLPTTAIPEPVRRTTVGRDLYAEEVVRELVEMTPERLVQRMGPTFPETINRYVRMLDLPVIRKIPGLRSLIASRARGPGEVAALATNYVGYLLQGVLDIGYFLADLQGTISGPIFIDRLGALLVTATARNAKRLIMFGLAVFLLSGLVWLLHIMWLRWCVDKLQEILALPVLILGSVCLVIMIAGQWLRRIANQTSEEGERMVEAQFAAQTKALKQRYVTDDQQFLAERVVSPELLLRTIDDPDPNISKPLRCTAQDLLKQADEMIVPGNITAKKWSSETFGNSEEMIFLRNVALLHRDYQDSGLFRPTDTKMTTQLLGNLALADLRQRDFGRSASEARQLRSLDVARGAGVLFGGPYLWFNYMTRIITEETAKLLRDYNRHAIPLARLASAPTEIREEYRTWLSRRLGVAPDSISLPEPIGAFGDRSCAVGGNGNPAHPHRLFETVDFTAMDFLTFDVDREAELEQKYGSPIVRLLRNDRRRAIRRAFRSFPLHRFPEAHRTINPFSLYLDYFAGARVLLLPIRIAWWILRGIAFFFRSVATTIKDILHPEVVEEFADETDTFTIALRKIHRMRKPGFITSLWLRARFDLEYVGCPIPTVPLTVGNKSLFEKDLTFIGSTRRERLAAEQLVIEQRKRAERLLPTMERLGWDLQTITGFLRTNYPFLKDRSAEVMRAITTAWITNAEDIYWIAISIDSIKRFVEVGRHARGKSPPIPSDLPESRLPHLDVNRPFATRARTLVETAFKRLDIKWTSDKEHQAATRYLLRNWATVKDWVLVVDSLPDHISPVEVLHARLREIILRTDLWSDQIVVLRTLQTLSVIDVYHYCRIVWALGGYGDRDHVDFPTTLPTNSEPLAWSTAVAGA